MGYLKYAETLMLALAVGVWQGTEGVQNPVTRPLVKSLMKVLSFLMGRRRKVLRSQGGAEGDAQEGADARAAAARPEQSNRGGDRDVHDEESRTWPACGRRVSAGLGRRRNGEGGQTAAARCRACAR